MRKTLLIIFVVLIFCLPLFVLAALELEQTYPEVPGAPSVQTITTKTSIPKLIKYYSTWAIVLAILLVIISLIIGGLQYLSSTGKAEAMSQAKSRILKSFLGLAILVSSYLILNIVNPQVKILQIKKVPVSSGIVLLTKDALEGNVDKEGLCKEKAGGGFEKSGCLNPEGPNLKELIEMGEARYLPGDVPSLTEHDQLDILTAVHWDNANKPDKANFEDFSVYAVGFWGETAQNMKVIFYAEKNFQGTAKEYTYDGLLDDKGEVDQNRKSEPCGDDPEVRTITMEPDFTDEGEVVFIDPGPPTARKDYPEGWPPTPGIIHPPLSVKMEGIGAGVYLYAKESQAYFIGPDADFSFKDFDDKAEEIEIKNKKIVKKKVDTQIVPEVVEKHDYLAILHDDAQFKGNLRIFFEEREWRAMPKIYTIKEFTAKQGKDVVDLNKLRKPGKGFWSPSITGGTDYFKGAYLLDGKTYTVGNVPLTGDKVLVNELDQYGKANGPSSIQVFELAERPSVCEEVRLCSQTYLQGYCLSYTNLGTLKKGLYQAFNLPMPWYMPVTIPNIIFGNVKTEEGEHEIKTYDEAGFGNNIRSMFIDGECLVVLFQNPVKDFEKCVTEDLTKCWANDSPGERSEVFISPGRLTVDDLSKGHPIGSCFTGPDKLGLGEVQSCASGIVVFPIK